MKNKQDCENLAYNITVHFLNGLDQPSNNDNPLFKVIVADMVEHIHQNIIKLFPDNGDTEKAEIARSSINERIDRIKANDYKFTSDSDKVLWRFAVKQYRKQFQELMGDPSGKKLFK